MKIQVKILIGVLMLLLLIWEVCAIDQPAINNIIWELGDDEAPPDYGDTAFDEFDQSGFDGHYYADTEPVSEFPKEINDGTLTQIYVYYTLNSEEANEDLYLFLDTLYATHENNNTGKIIPYYNLRIKVGSDKDNLTPIGEYKFGSADSEYPENRSIIISKKYLSPGENIILLENANSRWSGHWMVWDSLKLCIGACNEGENDGIPPYLLVGLLIFIIILSIVSHIIRKRKISEDTKTGGSPVPPPPPPPPVTALNKDEKRIINVVIQSEQKNEPINQRSIAKHVNLPPATIKNIIDKLEIWGILERERKGRENIIKLKKWVWTVLSTTSDNKLDIIRTPDAPSKMIELVLLLKEKEERGGDGSFMTQQEIANKIGVVPDTVRAYLDKLQDKQIIKEIPEKTPVKKVKLQQWVKDEIDYSRYQY